MATTTAQPVYSWRDSQPKSTYFGALQSPNFFNANASGPGQQLPQQNQPQAPAAPGAPAPGAPPQGGFNVPGGSSAGFDSANFNAGGGGQAPAAPKPPAASSFSDALRQNPLSQPLITEASKSIMQDLGPQQGPSMGSMFALNEFNKTQAEGLRQSKEASALAGRGDTGQAAGDVQETFSKSLLPARQNFLGQLQGQEEQQAQARKQGAIGNLATLAGIQQQAEEGAANRASQEKIAFANLSVQEKQLAQEGAQFSSRLDFDKWATQKGLDDKTAERIWQANENEKSRISTEKVSFAGLDLQKQQLAQQAMQFDRKEDFDRWALTQNLSQEDKKLIWQATESQKDRDLQKGEGAMSRELQKYLTEKGLDLDAKKINESIRQFDSAQDFSKWATLAGFDENAKGRIWQANQNDVQRKHEMGMQLTAQESNVLLETMRETHDTAMADLNHTLNLDTLDKQQKHEDLMKHLDQDFTVKLTHEGYSHEESMAATKQEYAKELEKMGYDQQTALQASDQWFKAKEAQADRDQAKLLTEAELAQKYDFFKADLQQKYQFHDDDVAMAKATLAEKVNEFTQSVGLEKSKLDLLTKDADFSRLQDTVSTMIAMGGDDPNIMRTAAETLFKGLGNVKDSQGNQLIPTEQVTQGLLNIKASSFKDPVAFTTWAQSEAKDGQPAYTPDQIQAATKNIKAAGPGGNSDAPPITGVIEDMGDSKQAFNTWLQSRNGNTSVTLPNGNAAKILGQANQDGAGNRTFYQVEVNDPKLGKAIAYYNPRTDDWDLSADNVKVWGGGTLHGHNATTWDEIKNRLTWTKA